MREGFETRGLDAGWKGEPDMATDRTKRTERTERFETHLGDLATIDRVARVQGLHRHGDQLREALDADQFEVHYQPVVSLPGHRLVAVEALVRWAHPERGLVPPVEFIPAAEQSGFIVELGQWVLETACTQVRAWQLSVPALADLRVAVNLSARQMTPSLPRQVKAVLERSGLHAECLDLEITESVVMSDLEPSLAVLDQLAALGVGLSIDDFGTGFSSLAYLKWLPVSTLKIDRSFVEDLNDDPREVSIVAAIIALAAALGFNQIAEGVETEAQLQQLEALGCAQAQGYLFSRPLPPATFLAGTEDLLETWVNRDDADTASPVQVVVCDDDPSIRRLYRRALTSLNAQAIEVEDAASCITALSAGPIDLVILDVELPGRTGLDALDEIRQLSPDTQVVVVSGLVTADVAAAALESGAAACISKMQFLPVVRQMVDRCRP